MRPFIVLKHVSKVIRGQVILDKINLSLDRGKIYGFIGVNGSGKTMLFRMISGLILPSEGQVSINGLEIGRDIDFPPSIGVLLGKMGFETHLTGWQCLENLARIRGEIGSQEIAQNLKRLGLNPRDKRTYGQYSLGMKQRLAIVQAIMEEPELIILDEAFSALDEGAVSGLRRVLKEERQRGACVLISSHEKSNIELLCDEVFEMRAGRLRLAKDLRHASE